MAKSTPGRRLPLDKRESGWTSVNDTVAEGDRGKGLEQRLAAFLDLLPMLLPTVHARFFSVLESGVFS